MNAPHALIMQLHVWIITEKSVTTGLVHTKCHQSNYWASNNFCQLSCFKSNNGYKGNSCCDNGTPVLCNIFINEEITWIQGHNKHCNSSNLLLIKCKFSSTWVKENLHQQSCFEEGYGYGKNNCCESAKTPT